MLRFITFSLFLSFFPALASAQEVTVEEVIECFGTTEECATLVQTYIRMNPNGGVQVLDAVNVGGTNSVVAIDTDSDVPVEVPPPVVDAAVATTKPEPTNNRAIEGAFGLSLNTGGAAVGNDGVFLLTPGLWGEIDGNGSWSFQFHGGVGFGRAFERNWYAPTTWLGANRRWTANSLAIGGRLQYVRSMDNDSVVIGALEPRFRHRFTDSFGIGAYAQLGVAVVSVETGTVRRGTAMDVYGEHLEQYQGLDDVYTTTIDNEVRPEFGTGFELFVEF